MATPVAQTDWDLIRELLTAAVDACEAYERLNLTEDDRQLITGTDGVTVNDILISAWTFPENLQYAVIRARHDTQRDVPYRQDAARVLREVGSLCAELVGGLTSAEIGSLHLSSADRQLVEPLCRWYKETMMARLAQAAHSKEHA